ncbi:M14 family metallopeptidase [Lachnospiraceae bacterium 54-53]
MVETVVSVGLAVGENWKIYKNRIQPKVLTGKEKRLSVVTGVHGDELEGQFVCYELNRILREKGECLKGIVDIYPALNPLGLDSVTRGVPGFDIDMNRIFPGDEEGAVTEHIASEIMSDISGSDFCVDIHASNIFLREIPQIRMSEKQAGELLSYAELMNVDLVWIHENAVVLESTLSHGLNSIGVPTFVVEMGVGMRITRSYGRQLTEGILCLMKELGIWEGETISPKKPMISLNRKLGLSNAEKAGIFLPSVEHLGKVEEGEPVGQILNPLDGTVLEEVVSPIEGLVFTLREYPVVSVGSLLARVLGGEEL